MQQGKVYIVGAGPGHPELLTIKAAELLEAADVVIYDRLIQEEVLSLAKPSAERLYMGKPVGRHDSRQDEIHELMAQKAREGKSVVRLKGGDPFLFGRGGEEAEYLAGHGIAFEVIPGVSSALAAPLCAGIAVTHREASSCVTIATGHEAKEDVSHLDWGALARMETLVFLMGVKNAGKIADKLMEHGKSPDTPAAMVQMAFWHDEHVVVGTLKTIAADVEAAQVKPPATLVVGRVVDLRERIGSSQRELRRRADGSPRFEPAPPPDQLIRMALAGIGSQVLGFALELGLFDRLEEATALDALAAGLGLEAEALEDVLQALVGMGLVEETNGAFRNLDIASRYLRAASPHSLAPTLLYFSKQSGPWTGLAHYASKGRSDFLAPGNDPLLEAMSESLARFAAPAVLDKLSLAGAGTALLLGPGAPPFSEAIAERWPEVATEMLNPFAGHGLGIRKLLPKSPSGEGWGAVVLSAMLASCDRGQVQRILEEAAGILRPQGVIVLYDAFLPVSALPPVEVALGTLARHVWRGGCRTWSIGRLQNALLRLGFHDMKMETLPAGTVLVWAQKS
jgi:uroporphyrin-III C-methyltransferase